MPNRLEHAVSPYLLAHAQNPVDWHPWGEEAFAAARERDVPVFVSIGYSTCHWCHVMARESFSDPQLAARLNAEFVAIKVDREEHPDVDAAFLTAASAFTRNLGWPLSVFTTPDGQAFYAGTYFPPQPRGGVPSFSQVLDAVTDAWTQRRADVAEAAARVAAAVSGLRRANGEHTAGLDREALDRAVSLLVEAEDDRFGGFGSAPDFAGPKFPATPVLGFLLGSDNPVGVATALHTLRLMASSPLRDAVDGGFFRYGTRRDWSSPHYERMLYDNAALLRLYADASVQPEADEPAIFAETADGIASFLLSVLRVPGGFASAQDSESEVDGVRREGAYYLLDAQARAAQPRPAVDGKVLTGWNGLAIGALARSGALLGRPEWTAEAVRTADELISAHVVTGERMLVRASLAGRASDASPALEDYGLFASGLLDVFLATGEPRFALTARRLVDATLDAAGEVREPVPFALPGGGDPVLSAHGLIADADPSEGAVPSGASALAGACVVLYALTGDSRYNFAASGAIDAVAAVASQNPLAFGAALKVAAGLGADQEQLVVVTPSGDGVMPGAEPPEAARPDPERPDAVHPTAATPGVEPPDAMTPEAVPLGVEPIGDAAIARAVARRGASVGVALTQGAASVLADAGFSLFEGRTAIGGVATEYLCRAFVCDLPTPFVS